MFSDFSMANIVDGSSTSAYVEGNDLQGNRPNKQPGVPDVDKEKLDISRSPFILFNYFRKTEVKNKVQCNSCFKNVDRTDGNTNGMFKHLKGTHPELLKLYLQHKNWIELRRKENRSNQK